MDTLSSAFQFQSVMEGLAYDGTDQAIGHGSDVEDDGLQFVVVDFAVCQDRFVGLLGYDFAYEDACIIVIAGTFTFQGDREFFDDRGIDVTALVDVAACLFNLIYLIARFYAKVIGNFNRILGGKGDGKGLGTVKALVCLMLSVVLCLAKKSVISP